MKINRNNYEPFFLDYSEGNLEPSMVPELQKFLSDNPDLAEELTFLEPLPSETGSTIFPHKAQLYKSVLDDAEAFNERVIGLFEGDLCQSETNELLQYLEKHPDRQADLESFRAARISPDLTVSCQIKHKLYRQPGLNKPLLWSLGIAASLLLMISIYTQLPPEGKTQPAETKMAASVVEIPETNKNELVATSPEVVDMEQGPQPGKMETEIRQVRKASLALSPKPEYPEKQIARNSPDLPTLLPAITVSYIPTIDNEQLFALHTTEQQAIDHFSNDEPEPLTDKLIRKTGLEGFSFASLVRSGLDLANTLSNNRFSYSTDKAGQVVSLTLETELLGLSLPVNRKE